jgi:hypothetical protein
MKVSFAAQVLSNTGEASETAKFCQMMNDFFDCMNVRSTSERERNPRLAPYQHTDDNRFDWLKNEFLLYLTSWKSSIDSREGPFSIDDKGRMFLSVQTFTSLKMTVNSVVALTRFLLSEGFEFVLSLTKRFCQDDVEEYFGYQRAQGRRNDNPTAVEFGYNDLKIATLRDVAPQSIEGNVSGRHSGKRSKWCNVSEEALPKKEQKTNQEIVVLNML